ncbi:MAG: arabinose isomerase [Eubacteriales bacterium]|nr:arabinose isomerase [Eubacteriales bacterium]
MKHRPVIGTMAVGLIGYWPQFPGMKEYLTGKHRELLDKIDGEAEIIDAGMIDTVEKSREAGRKFQSADVDIIFCQAMTYATSDNLIPAVRDLEVPVILFNVQEDKSLDFSKVKNLDDWLGHGCTCAGLPELSAMLRRYGKCYDIVTGYLKGDAAVDEAVVRWVKAAGIRRKLKTTNAGILGRQYLGMMDLYLDENAVMKQFGMMTRFLMWEDVIALSEQVTEEEKRQYTEKMKEIFDIPAAVSHEELENIAVMYGGYLKLAEQNHLSILANHFEKQMTGKEVDLMAALNPAHTMLIHDGLACTVEGDIKGAVAMTILKAMGGDANLTELYSMDFNDDTCIIGHSGASDPMISDKRPVLKKTSVFHGKSGKGFTTQAVPRKGPITMLALTMEEDGTFKMVAAEGEVVDGEILNLGDTNCRVKFPVPMREFINRWSMEGPSHHGVMGSGAHVRDLEAAAKVLGVRIEVITRL